MDGQSVAVEATDSTRQTAIAQLKKLQADLLLETIWIYQVADLLGNPAGEVRVHYLTGDRGFQSWPIPQLTDIWLQGGRPSDPDFLRLDAVDFGLAEYLFSRCQKMASPSGINALEVPALELWIHGLAGTKEGLQSEFRIVNPDPGQASQFDIATVGDMAQFVARTYRNWRDELDRAERSFQKTGKWFLKDETAENWWKLELSQVKHLRMNWKRLRVLIEMVKHYASALMPEELAKCRALCSGAWVTGDGLDIPMFETELDLLSAKLRWFKPIKPVRETLLHELELYPEKRNAGLRNADGNDAIGSTKSQETVAGDVTQPDQSAVKEQSKPSIKRRQGQWSQFAEWYVKENGKVYSIETLRSGIKEYRKQFKNRPVPSETQARNAVRHRLRSDE